MQRTFVRVVCGLVGFFYVVSGIWALSAPQSFFDMVASWPPFNEHFLHDSGSFQIGLGVALLAALRWRDGFIVALGGVAAASIAHVYSHVIDLGEGGRDSDPIGLGLVVVLIIAALVIQLRSRSAESSPQQG